MAKKYVKITNLGLQSGGTRTLYVTWSFTESYVDHYLVQWFYGTGDGVWFKASDSANQVKSKQDTYSIPSNAIKVKVRVKPVAKTYNKKVGNKTVEAPRWDGDWCADKTYYVKKVPPDTPSSAPTVEINGLTLTAEVTNLDSDISKVTFYVVESTSGKFYASETVSVNQDLLRISKSWSVEAGKKYSVRYKVTNKAGIESLDWSPYSGDSGTRPGASSGITSVKALSSTSIQIDWAASESAESYTIEYTTKKTYFDTSTNISSVNIDKVSTTAIITGLETGQEYYFRVKAVNEYGESSWTEISNPVVLGKKPAAPTTWSSTTTVMVGEKVKFYWVHNTEDGSSQVSATLEITVNGTVTTIEVPNENLEDEDKKDKTSVYDKFDTSSYAEGTSVKWRVKTCGITGEYGDWSVQRTVDIYAPPVLTVTLTDKDGNLIDEDLQSFPFYIKGVSGPSTQKAIGYHIIVSSTEAYETVDAVGNRRLVGKNESIYSKYFDINTDLNTEMSAKDIDLENNITYKVTVTVAMNSGLTAESSQSFKVAWEDQEYDPDIDITIDPDTFSAYLLPYCMYKGEIASDVTLSVYRREYDGSFTEIITGLDNTKGSYVTDPHPALDYARYRVVAISNSTGAVSFYDPPGYPIGESAVIIQWDEDWSYFDVTEDLIEEPVWTGSLLKLPYNIDVSDNNSPDVDLIEYIGRKRPVSYYGTQLGSTATWNVEIDKEDIETIYALRRLMNYMGDVYVREPSGSGYWANVKVSMSRKYNSLVIPVTFNITRVEGGM